MLKSWWIFFFEFVGFGSTLKNATLKNDPGVWLVISRLGGSQLAYLLLRTLEDKQTCARADASRPVFNFIPGRRKEEVGAMWGDDCPGPLINH